MGCESGTDFILASVVALIIYVVVGRMGSGVLFFPLR
jgi:hypothetical protein